MKLSGKLGYVGAGLTVFAAALAPFSLYGIFTKGFSSLGLRVSETYSGGPKARTIQATGYTIDVHLRVSPRMLQREKSFVQLDWKPANALPAHVSDRVDIDGDGNPDVHVDFNVPKDPKASLRVNVESLNPIYEEMRNVGKEKFSALIVRVDNGILVRVPLAQ